MLVQNEKRLHGERHSAFSSELNSEMIQNPVNAHHRGWRTGARIFSMHCLL